MFGRKKRQPSHWVSYRGNDNKWHFEIYSKTGTVLDAGGPFRSEKAAKSAANKQQRFLEQLAKL